MISIIIPARNAHNTLEILLNSIRASSFKDMELIVIDDASTDETAQISRKLGARIIRLEKQSGPAVARNRGAEVARGEILLFLDSDVRIHHDTLLYIVERFAREPELNCLVGIYSKRPLNKGLFPLYKALLCYFWFKDAEVMESFETSCGAIRRDVFMDAGGFNTKYSGAEVEDYEFGYRLGEKYKIVLDTRIQVDHHFPGFPRNARNFFHRGRLWFKIFMKRRQFDSAGSTSSEAVGTIASMPVLVAFLYTLFSCGKGGFALAICCTLYLFINGRFFIFCLKELGVGFCSAAIVIHLANSLVILAGVAAALLQIPCRGKRVDA